MRTILFDPVHGAAGDMIIAGLLAAGADRDATTGAMASIVREPEITRVMRGGIQALHIRTHAEETTRTLDEVIARIRDADVSDQVKDMAARIFARINDAETRVHGAHAHFHEVGADDAVADVIGAVTALLSLAPDAVAVRTIPLGSGTIQSAHGQMPVPAPATAYILEQSHLSTRIGPEGAGELVTPTGAAILAEFHAIYGRAAPEGRICAVGYGAGSRNPPDYPNVLRVMIIGDDTDKTDVDILETNVDDVDGEVIGSAIERLHREGARDASAAPIIMKKGRPGHLIRVICRKEDSGRLACILAEELGTLGVRCIGSVHRFIAEREFKTVTIPTGDEIPVKIGHWEGRIISVKAEFDSVAAAAERHGMTVREVKRLAEEAARRELQ
ncbi:MAG: nickel pincer cofactor biosynthesis protein LarC [Methanocalculus sp. MSAO_Arc1]|uniref:nickel pincer cofactor biosynthesis protein LarC n=1 Tax=Methanocalculus TaxID=71151 RepID=UPI000FF44175|nr:MULTISPECIES: nickel pincer cofactor biosynthesis protein LarC [unclassified Methanocalculus]MCP1662716.1 uncharacterized protein (TIGR00299 family) protein [Methanocalculus sp. AMF5]RQD79972.1 MAG: nickel pincer cofactor biosynthesis protein LarC [Methanocalculus sp. MSAO_Arc1]